MKYNGFYLVGNYPDQETFLQAAIEGLRYFDFIEIGLPFSDPVADGPVLASASHKALEAGVTTEAVLQSCSKLNHYITNHDKSKKIFIMTYANKVFHNGIDTAFHNFTLHGVNGIILADVPYVESHRFVEHAKAYNLDYIHFITPESTVEQIQNICSQATGFLYTVSLRGTTGSTLIISDEIKHILTTAKRFTKVPVLLGFGIQNKEDIAQALQYADGFIMGTAVVKKLEEGINTYKDFLHELFN
ncbi:MAG: tryptophan synthase subunit alpha [Spirochaetota bacterium]